MTSGLGSKTTASLMLAVSFRSYLILEANFPG
jgi:hypothetical protein